MARQNVNEKVILGVSVSAEKGVEMINVDKTNGQIIGYAVRPLGYDYARRDIADYNVFRQLLLQLFDELNILPQNAEVVISMPSVELGVIELPLNLPDEDVNSQVLEEVSRKYLFKSETPIIDWVNMFQSSEDSKGVLYSAIQKSTVLNLRRAFNDIGSNLVCVENSYASLLKAISASGVAQEQMQPNVTWNLMLVGDNKYSIITLVEKSVLSVYEEPLKLQNFNGDEVYNAIINASQLTLQAKPTNYLYIVSETDLVSAEVLAMKIPFNAQVQFLECNKYVQGLLMNTAQNILPDVALKISPEAIGAGIYILTRYPIRFNMLGNDSLEEEEMIPEPEPQPQPQVQPRPHPQPQPEPQAQMQAETNPWSNQQNIQQENNITTSRPKNSFAVKFLNTMFVLLVIFWGLIYGILEVQTSNLNKFDTLLNNSTGTILGEKAEIDKVIKDNRTKMLYYSAIGFNIPKKVWLTNFVMTENAGIYIKGKATCVEDIYAFYKGLKYSIINSDLRMNKLQMMTTSLEKLLNNSKEPMFYEFVITNLSDSEINTKILAKEEPKSEKPQVISKPEEIIKKEIDELPANLEKIEDF